MLYFAYGMNTNAEQMATRCPDAIALGRFNLKKFKFVYRGVADVVYTGKEHDSVDGVLWNITTKCEKSLDSLEGYPNFYTKNYINRGKKRIMFYIMTKQHARGLNLPSDYYHDMLEQGYKYFNCDAGQLYDAIDEAYQYYNEDKRYDAQEKFDMSELYNQWPPKRWYD